MIYSLITGGKGEEINLDTYHIIQSTRVDVCQQSCETFNTGTFLFYFSPKSFQMNCDIFDTEQELTLIID